MYAITNEGLKVLEEKGLKKILDNSFKNFECDILMGYLYDDIIEDYAKEHGIPNLVEKVATDEFDREDSFIINSEIICNQLKDKLPKNINKELKDVISAYYIYYKNFFIMAGYKGDYIWRDEQFLNVIKGDVHGDMIIHQYDLSQDFQRDLFNYKPLVKKTGGTGINGFYPYWIEILSHFITFCCQIGKPVPFRDNWKEEFYNEKFEEIKPGEVASGLIEQLKNAKESKEYSFIQFLPFIDNPFKHINTKRNFFHIHPIRSDGGYESMPFIDKNNLIYLHKAEKGIEFLEERWGSLGVRFDYEQIEHAIRGVVSCIQKGGSRCIPKDPGLVFKYFPYEKFNDLL